MPRRSLRQFIALTQLCYINSGGVPDDLARDCVYPNPFAKRDIRMEMIAAPYRQDARPMKDDLDKPSPRIPIRIHNAPVWIEAHREPQRQSPRTDLAAALNASTR